MSQVAYIGCDFATIRDCATPYGLIRNGAVAVDRGRIEWAGPKDRMPRPYRRFEPFDLGGGVVTPGLIDCHTHLVFGGDRANEFEQRLLGVDYEEIAKAGGGIVSTMRDTREASEDDLFAAALRRLDGYIAEGVAAIEIKSGYGLSVEHELKMLRVARRLSEARPVRIMTTWLAAHAVPPEYRGRPDAYIDEVAVTGLMEAHADGLVDAVDGFCESIAFSRAQISRVFDAADSLGLPKKIHAEQLSDSGGAELAASFGALSADHLEHLSERGVAALAKAGTAAVLLPGAFYSLREPRAPPVGKLREARVPIAVATDANPGSSPVFSLLIAMNMACVLFRLTPEEALSGATAVAARALGIQDDSGTLERGKRADMAVWDIDRPAELSYRMGFNPLKHRIFGGIACKST